MGVGPRIWAVAEIFRIGGNRWICKLTKRVGNLQESASAQWYGKNPDADPQGALAQCRDALDADEIRILAAGGLVRWRRDGGER